MRERSAHRRNRRSEMGTPGPQAEVQPSWRLPSGLELTEFALQGGFLMPALMAADRSGEHEKSSRQAPRTTVAGGQG
ncbi:MAG: hypothetical protein NTY38_31690 [Acidobacteria bacterium]|nr:hypothetical protein [Acidobacteriota bacterium]